MKKGKFIVFEGIDGSGKSFQIRKLTEFISNLDKHSHILITREPYQEREIREILKLAEKPEERAEKLAELFVKDRNEHVSELILPNLNRSVIVISDRYKYSTICYQAAQGLEVNKLVDMHKNLMIPDIIFVIDIPVSVAMERMQKDNIRKTEQKFEKNPVFLEKVRQNYLSLPKLFPNENMFIINGNKSIEDVSKEIWDIFVSKEA